MERARGHPDVARLVGLGDDFFTVAVGQRPFALPAQIAPAKKNNDAEMDLLADAKVRDGSSSRMLGNANPASGAVPRDSFKALSLMLGDMFGLPATHPLMEEVAGTDEHLPCAEAEEDSDEDEPMDDAEGEAGVADVTVAAETLDDVLKRLGIRAEGKVYFKEEPAGSTDLPVRRRLGVVNVFRSHGQEKALQAVCSLGHGHCRMQIDFAKCSTRLELETVMAEWLAAGVGLSASEHFHRSAEIKRSLGIKVRQ